MNKLKFITASALAAGMLLAATPALANTGRNDGNSGGFRLGGFLNLPIAMHVGANANVGAYKNDYEKDYKFASTTATTTPFTKPFGNDVEIGVVGSTNGSVITLDPAINLSGTTTAATTVVTNASTTFKGATSTAYLISGEKVIVVGTTSTSSPGTITASFVILLKNAWHFCTHLF